MDSMAVWIDLLPVGESVVVCESDEDEGGKGERADGCWLPAWACGVEIICWDEPE